MALPAFAEMLAVMTVRPFRMQVRWLCVRGALRAVMTFKYAEEPESHTL